MEDVAALCGSPALQTSTSALALAEAFAGFVATSSRLEDAYRELQGDVSGLRMELAERNAALKASLSENQRVRMALQQIVDSMPCGVLVARRNGQLTTVNPEAKRLLGLPVTADVPASLTEIEAIYGIDLRSTHSADSDAAEQEFCWKSPAGERWLHILIRQVTEDGRNGSRELTILILRDITAHKLAENERENARKASVLAQITSMLAHEIRNPLGSLELFAQLIEEDAAGREEWISNLRAGIRSLSGTVNNVLSFHEAGALQLKQLRLVDVVANTVSFARPLANQAEVALHWSGTDRDRLVHGNSSALQQVLLNLIRNALRHTPAGGSITLRVAASALDQIAVHCTDTGSGIPADQIGRIFEPGFSGRGDSPGLGLAVCQRIMKQHSGRISATNVPDAGARFTLVFPIFKQESSAA